MNSDAPAERGGKVGEVGDGNRISQEAWRERGGACGCVEHDDGIVGPSSGDDCFATVVQTKVVKKAGNGLGDGMQDGA